MTISECWKILILYKVAIRKAKKKTPNDFGGSWRLKALTHTYVKDTKWTQFAI